MKGVSLTAGSEAFTRRLQDSAPGLQDLQYGPQVYDAVVVTALAAAMARTDAPAAIARQIDGVTKGGAKCTSYADCKALVQEGKDIDSDGASGLLEFTDAGEPTSSTYVIRKIRADGSLEPLMIVER